MGASILFTAAMIRANNTARSRGNGGTYVSTREWQELEYRIDVCLVTRGAHIEHLWLLKKLFQFSCDFEQFH
jgi:hypothetical protein